MNNIFVNFSDWILTWFILYKFKIIKYNPKIFILFGIIDNIIGLTIMIIKYKDKINIKNKLYDYIEISIHFIIKILMFYSLKNSLYNINDFIGSILIFSIYNIYLKIRYNLTIFELKKRNIQKNKKNFT
jgi:hypothetical protein